VGAIKTVYDQVCGPKAVVAIGSCPATTNVFIDSRTLDGPLNRHIPVDVFVPGCPPRPDAIILGVAKAAEILAERAGKQSPSTPVVMQLSGSPCDESCACVANKEAVQISEVQQ
jgi:Ni,Fe-hydrogenase III small subunit